MNTPLDVNSFTTNMGCCSFNDFKFIGCKGVGDKRIINLEINCSKMKISEIPESLSGLVDLERIAITKCGKMIDIPLFLKDLPNLTTLEIFDNQNYNNIPANIMEMKNLKSLTILKNNIGGPIPENIGNLENLEDLYIQDNLINGKIPETLGNLINLKYLSLKGNLIEGTLPSSIGNLANVKYIDLSNNNLNGEIPESIGKLGKLESLSLKNNRFGGQIPETISNLKSLKKLDLSNNRFSDTAEFSLSFPSLANIDLSESGILDVVPKFSEKVNKCNFDMKNFCVSEEETLACGYEGPKCTDEFMQKLNTFKNEKKLEQQRRKEMENETGSAKSKYVIALIIILIPLVSIATFLHWYNKYSSRKEDEMVIKHIDMMNSRHSYIYSDVGSDANLMARSPYHRKLSPYGEFQPTRNIFDDNDDDLEINDEGMDNIESDVAERVLDCSSHTNSIPRHVAESFHQNTLPRDAVDEDFHISTLPRDVINGSIHNSSLPRDVINGSIHNSSLPRDANLFDNSHASVHSSYYSHPNNSSHSIPSNPNRNNSVHSYINHNASIHSHHSNANNNYFTANPFSDENAIYSHPNTSSNSLNRNRQQPQNSSSTFKLEDQQNPYQLEFDNISLGNSLHLFNNDYSHQ